MDWRHVLVLLFVALIGILYAFGSPAPRVQSHPQQPSQGATPASRQRALNTISRGAWELFENHRLHTTNLALSAKREPGPRLLVLGAGNCNDLDLKELVRDFSSVHLCDVDKQALAHGVEKQLGIGSPEAQQVTTHVMDITGIFPLLAKLDKAKKNRTKLLTELQSVSVALSKFHPRELSPKFREGFDVVLSASVLSQIIVTIDSYVDDPDLGTMLQINVRDAHLRTMVELLKTGGTGILITDFVSTDTYDPLWSMSDQKLTPIVLAQLLDQKNFFTGCHPTNILSKLRNEFSPLITEISLVSVWKWALSRQRQYAVAALQFRRR